MDKIFKKICHKCNGEGAWTKDTVGGSEVIDPCLVCNGEKYTPLYYISLPDKVFYSHEILEATDPDEYDDLDDEEEYDRLLNCGIVDLNDGKYGKTKLWELFDSESTTRANLVALIS